MDVWFSNATLYLPDYHVRGNSTFDFIFDSEIMKEMWLPRHVLLHCQHLLRQRGWASRRALSRRVQGQALHLSACAPCRPFPSAARTQHLHL